MVYVKTMASPASPWYPHDIPIVIISIIYKGLHHRITTIVMFVCIHIHIYIFIFAHILIITIIYPHLLRTKFDALSKAAATLAGDASSTRRTVSSSLAMPWHRKLKGEEFWIEIVYVIQNGYEATMWRWYIKMAIQLFNHESQNWNMAYLCRCELEKNL